MINRAAYLAHEILVGPARARPDLWRVAAGLVIVILTTLTLSNLITAVLFVAMPQRDTAPETALRGQTPLGLLFLLGGFIFITIGTALAARLLHDRSLASILGPLTALRRDFIRVFVALLILGFAIAILPPYDLGAPLTPNLAPGLWLLLLPLSLTALLIQTSAEEILFRGYLQQQLAARFASPVIWMAIPSALFALGHYLPAEAGDNALFIVAWAGIFGVLMADLTARAGNLGPAIAVHFANNLSAIILVSLPDSLSGLSLYTIDLDLSDASAVRTWLPVEFAMMFVLWLTARLAIRR